MTPATFIVDTSALIDTIQVGNDEWGKAFAHAQSKYDVLAPLRVVYEVGNIVHRKHPTVFGKDLAERQLVVREILQGVRIAPFEPASIERAGEITEKHGVTYYDATFLDLAIQTKDSILLAQDDKLLDAGKKALSKDRALNLDEFTEKVGKKKL